MKPKILVVDDDRYTRALIEQLMRHSAQVHLAENGEVARQLFEAIDFNLVLMDQRLPQDTGLDLLREFRAQRPKLVAILITGHADVRDAVAAVREGLFDYLTKPFEDLEALEAVIGKALELDSAYREIDSLRTRLAIESGAPDVIGQSPAMERLLGQVREVAALDTTVLLEGESGTGKDVMAKLIHAWSQRASQPYLEVNCGGLPESLLESLLFGFEKGAFTGASQATPGYFEKAHNGNLFLDEIADMSPKLQSSLLRVLQDRSFCRIGSTSPRKTDFRLICATNRPLAGEVKAGRFREDLYYRINVVALGLPPLRERGDDIIRLALHFLDRYNAKFGKQCGPFTPQAVRALEACRWPGNVRQLQHCIERVVALEPGGIIDAKHLGPSCECQLAPDLQDSAAPSPSPSLAYQEARAEFERNYMRRLLEAAGGNMSEAARCSGIPRQNLYVRMKRWGFVTE
ncbi:MAG: sigma-54 dependent transcriptional regulator [Gammaproteobacteria bacterium]|uniref:sigma-54-dependent transcriptional regulator n=1 Tax=Rhodoferax sp. TaxID=50421 RepID=UPI0017A1B21F|nr:sigma-54 dependent transcriptional regulator [Rhodoferax sp.]MBU3899841.1 sigma-54 dependent transcriptional regulator [Gammaproteobacteria bacterium]MBA3057953.1 sigma-54-dependent Fis family transcriptional regulator [Rhodoferax sp.]MBU3996024.1 sigma-54 dependent transcriptional regulator [Gammaproteobacteria bacterium]MBU4019106.1 sigma-54 dependent transcriptional regulator [Gammaproteobacteria bacterium]MBU4078824.1 sigma-54 dependent transcriptional regulator [Gammaproteobacteria bac